MTHLQITVRSGWARFTGTGEFTGVAVRARFRPFGNWVGPRLAGDGSGRARAGAGGGSGSGSGSGGESSGSSPKRRDR